MRMQPILASVVVAGLFVGTPVLAGDNDELDTRMDDALAQSSAEEAAQADQQAATGEAEDGQDQPQSREIRGRTGAGDTGPGQLRAMQFGQGDMEVTSGTAFNPAISVILDGAYYNEFSGHVEDPAGFDTGHGHDHGHGGHDHGFSDGFNLREVELVFEGTVDPYFDMMVQLAAFEEGIEIEEAFITTRSLPAGWQVKAGRFLSDVGYINQQHLHDWQFADQPWVIENMFGEEGLVDNGIQLSWMPGTESYTRFGVELLQGEGVPGIAEYEGDGNHDVVTVLPQYMDDPDMDWDDEDAYRNDRIRWRDNTGFEETTPPNLATFFANWAPNLGYAHDLQLGVSYGVSDVLQRQEAHSSGRLETWDGDSEFWGLDAVYKYNGQGIHGHRNFVLQAEYFNREQDLHYMSRNFADLDTLEPTGGDDPDVRDQRWKQDGLYVQGVYGFAPRWNAGLRVDAMGLTNDAYTDQDAGRGLPVEPDPSYRYSAQMSWLPTEFSRIRGQLNYNDVGGDGYGGHSHDAWEFILQYNMAIGVHGAHDF